MTRLHRFVVISGVPGCGKTTIGHALADHLAIPHLDKDAILESLFDGVECSDEATRHQLSREADREFETIAQSYSSAILDSFWRHPSAEVSSGTPSAWLPAPEIYSVEVYCRCAPEISASRFLERGRHNGHLDFRWNQVFLVVQLRDLARTFPLGVGSFQIEVDTTDDVDTILLAEQVRIPLG